MDNNKKHQEVIDELLQKDLVFVDFEANQFKYCNYLLQFACIKRTKDNHIIKISNNVYQNTPLTKRISKILKKPYNYFKNQTFIKEKEAYQALLSFTENCLVITYGSYDQHILDDIAKRFHLPQIPLIDISKNLCCGLKDTFSLSKMAFLLGIDERKYKRHNSSDDAQLLYDVFMKYCSLKDKIDWDKVVEFLKFEQLRPRLAGANNSTAYPNLKIKPHHFYVIDLLFKKNIAPSDEDDITKFSVKHFNFVITNNGKILFHQSECKTNLTKEEKNQMRMDKLNILKQELLKYKTNLVLITNHDIANESPEIFIDVYNCQKPYIYKIAWDKIVKNLHISKYANNEQELIDAIKIIENSFFNKTTFRFDYIKRNKLPLKE